MSLRIVPIFDEPHVAELLSEFSSINFSHIDSPQRLQSFVTAAKPPLVVIDPDHHPNAVSLAHWCVSQGAPVIAMSKNPNLHQTLTTFAVDVCPKPFDPATTSLFIERCCNARTKNLPDLFQHRLDWLSRRPLITVIDDSIDDAEAISAAIGDRCELAWTQDPLDLPPHQPDLVLLDLYFFGENLGLKTLSALDPTRVPIIIMSSQTNARTIRRALDLGAAYFLPKGAFVPDDLFARISCHIADTKKQ